MSFDRVADVYDATRALPKGVPDAIAGRVVEATNAGPETRFLELGVGTGRIAEPLIAAGYPYTGVDISADMLARLRAKAGDAPNLTIVEGDVTDLPFPDDSFDVALTVHVLHLVSDWHKALAEARRALTPHGYFIVGHDHSLEGTPARQIRRQWRIFTEEAGGKPREGRVSSEDIYAALIEMGARMAIYHVARWERAVIPADLIELIHARKYSWSWNVSDAVLDEAHGRMLTWAAEQYGDITAPQPDTGEFTLAVATFDS